MSSNIHHHYVTLNGYKMHYASCGEASRPLILCLHGFPESWIAWQGVLQTLGQHFHVVAPDTRGINESEGPEDLQGYRTSNMVSDVAALLDHLGKKKCVLVGHDWGGAIACAFAIAHPNRLHGLVMVNSPHPAAFLRELAQNPNQREASAYIKLFLRDEAEAVVSDERYAYLRGMLAQSSQTGSPPSWFDEPLQAAYQRAWSAPGSVRAGLSYYRASQNLNPANSDEPSAREKFGDNSSLMVHAPTLFIWGEGDGFLLTGCLDGLDRYFTDVQVERIPEGSHWVIHEHRERVCQRISYFATQLDMPAELHASAD